MCSCWGSDNRFKLSRGESKEVVQKVSKHILREESPEFEQAFERTLTRQADYGATHLSEERVRALQSMENVDESTVVNEELRAELMKWAVQELSARNNHEVDVRKGEEKKKWIATGIAAITTIATVVVPIITASYACDDSGSSG